jgi:hypothetical protein
MALGADPGSVIRQVPGRVCLMIVAGVVIGLAASMWTTQFTTSLLFGLEPRHPVTLALAVVILSGAGCWRRCRPRGMRHTWILPSLCAPSNGQAASATNRIAAIPDCVSRWLMATYGLLLDASSPGWTRRVRSTDDLAILVTNAGIRCDQSSPTVRWQQDNPVAFATGCQAAGRQDSLQRFIWRQPVDGAVEHDPLDPRPGDRAVVLPP